LKGLLFDSNGNRMTPVHSNKQGLRYRYYQSWVLNHGHKDKAGIVNRVSAAELEEAVVEALKTNFSSQPDGAEGAETTSLVGLVERIDLLDGQLKITLKPLGGEADDETADNTLNVSWLKKVWRRKKEVLGSIPDAPHRPMRSETRAKLLKGIAQGRVWMEELVSHRDRTIHDIATRHNLSDRNVRSTISLGLLAPEIVEAAISGKLPRGLTVTQMTDLPSDWSVQKLTLGLV
jgi:hypothetical protein